MLLGFAAGCAFGLFFGWLLHRERVERALYEDVVRTRDRATATLAETSARLELANKDMVRLRRQLTKAQHLLAERDATVSELEDELAELEGDHDLVEPSADEPVDVAADAATIPDDDVRLFDDAELDDDADITEEVALPAEDAAVATAAGDGGETDTSTAAEDAASRPVEAGPAATAATRGADVDAMPEHAHARVVEDAAGADEDRVAAPLAPVAATLDLSDATERAEGGADRESGGAPGPAPGAEPEAAADVTVAGEEPTVVEEPVAVEEPSEGPAVVEDAVEGPAVVEEAVEGPATVEEPVAEEEPAADAEIGTPLVLEADAAETPAGATEDELQRISGIGPALERQLRAEGITTFRQLALLDDRAIAELAARRPRLVTRLRRGGWVAQARRLHVETHGSQP